MSKRRAKFRRHSGKMIKLFKDLFDVQKPKPKTKTKMKTKTKAKASCLRARVKMGPLELELTTVSLMMATLWLLQANSEALQVGRALNSFPSAASSARQERARKLNEPLQLQPDPMEPCYLANNRASETLTISEATPVGTIVGELMVNGDSSRDGNIELSIKMPPASSTLSALVQTQAGLAQREHQTNGYASTLEALHRGLGGAGAASESSSGLEQQAEQLGHAPARGGRPRSARRLGNLIDLMPPLSIEQHTKRLILAKKLDRENLERFNQAASFQSSFSSINSLSQASTGSLTVHIKCQLKEVEAPLTVVSGSIKGGGGGGGGNSTNTTLSEDPVSKSEQRKKSPRSSILIPIHLIITDENDNWPNFIGAPYIMDLNETAPVGSLLPGNEIVALDNDQQGPLSTIEYSIVPGSFYSDSFAFLNPLDARSLIVKDKRALDFEAQAKLQLKVMARDQGEPPNWAITSLFINLLDQDDLGPVFERDQYRAEVKENRPGELLEVLPKRLFAYDGDKQLAAPVSYAFHLRTNHSIHFELDPDLGHLRLKKALWERPGQQPICLLVRATQVDNEQRFSLTAIQLRFGTEWASGRKFAQTLERFLNDNNHNHNHSSGAAEESVVEFGQANYELEMSESAPLGATVFTARAGRSPAISYQLLDNELGFLVIEPQSGRVKLNRSLDFELFRHISVRILATLEFNDEPAALYPKLACDIARLQLNVLNFNDFKPEFSHDQYNFQLSISDLIANFEPQATRVANWPSQGLATTDASSTDSSAAEEALSGFGRRFGDFELDEGAGAGAAELPHYRAIQIGQVYCADRDLGDKVTLTLAGNKAHLFRLTQDGRLYLPLVNVTDEEVARTSKTTHEGQRMDSQDNSQVAWASRGEHQISNTPISGAFLSAARRNNPLATHSLDRNYLNYLLSELGQLGRVRLKVHATDQGQPTAKQSSALVVVSIISIDNFIIQRAQSQPLGVSPTASSPGPAGSEASVQLTNSTSYQTGAATGLMMIPSMDGRSFVHINADIIGNLLAGQNASSFKTDSRQISVSSDSLDLAASNPVGSALKFNESRRVSDQQQALSTSDGGKQQQAPPSLLLVDEEGAKFVAMPAAIEVYQRQVLEAADRQTRQKEARQLEHEAKSAAKQSLWHFWTNKLSKRADSGATHWLSLSTALMLHLIVVGALVMLVARLRSSLASGSGRDQFEAHNPNLGSSSDSDLWPRRLGRLSSYFGDKSSPADQAASVLTRNQASVARSSYGQPASVLTREQNHYAAFLSHPNRNQPPLSPPFAQSHHKPIREPQMVSSGAVVSAVANNLQPKQRPAELPTRQQQNLFDHLKLTLNKMLDASAEPAASANSQDPSMKQVSMRPLDSEVVAFEDMRDRELEVCAQLRETSELQQQQQQQQQRKLNAADEKAPVSTFVGAGVSTNCFAAQRSATMSPTLQQPHTSATRLLTNSQPQSGAVVSINIKGPAASGPRDMAGASSSLRQKSLKQPNGEKVGGHSSSNSSVISLVSMSSSLSNKINEAVDRARGEQADGSDASSLNSSILLNGVGDSSSCSSNGRRQAKAPAAPPSQTRAQLGSPNRVNKPTFRINKPQLETAPTNGSPSLRQRVPENPVHVRLRRQAMSELAPQLNAQEQGSTSPSGTINKAPQQVSAMLPTGVGASSVGGRREARTRVTPAAPPTPPPMPSTHGGQYLYGQGKSASKTTVSPTTSVDRGYESFQSYSSNCTQQQRSRQIHSLPEFDLSADKCEAACASQSLPSHNESGPTVSGLVLDSRKPARRADSPAARAECSRLALSSMRPAEADTEDDDFYYCCTEPVHSSEVHQLPAGGLLSGYVNHTYRHEQQLGRPSRTHPLADQSKRHEPTGLSSRCLAGKAARVQSRRSAEQNHPNTSNDLIPFCDQHQLHQQQQQQVVCDIGEQPARHQQAPAAKPIKRGRARPSVASGQSSQRPAAGYYPQPLEQRARVAFNANANGPINSNKKQLTWFDQVEVDLH